MIFFFNIHGKKGREEKVMKIPTYYYVYRSPTFNSEKIKSLVTYKQISASFPAVSQTVFRVLLVDNTDCPHSMASTGISSKENA